MPKIHTLDLNFQGVAHTIAAYAIPHHDGVVLIESGPGSTLTNLDAALRQAGFTPEQVSDVLLTHIHLDHAGAAGALARRGARIHVHPHGAAHMLDPEKLLASAKRIYQEQMDRLWGQFLPVPEENLHVVADEEEIEIGGLRFVALDTPGHANHHYAYLLDGVCFTGDVGGVRLPGPAHLRLPMPPPDFHIEKWRTSIARLRRLEIRQVAPTHFGIFDDSKWHLRRVADELDAVERWLEQVMPADPAVDALNTQFIAWAEARSRAEGLDENALYGYETANPSWMSAAGMQRYWRKYRAAD
ncbi:MAG: MBL fold metallo-hydrolase [Anaerolineales bacterium]